MGLLLSLPCVGLGCCSCLCASEEDCRRDQQGWQTVIHMQQVVSVEHRDTGLPLPVRLAQLRLQAQEARAER
jgi:hypothetical protein